MGLFSAIMLFRTTKNYILKKRMVEPKPDATGNPRVARRSRSHRSVAG
jgi:hypothetical protein